MVEREGEDEEEEEKFTVDQMWWPPRHLFVHLFSHSVPFCSVLLSQFSTQLSLNLFPTLLSSSAWLKRLASTDYEYEVINPSQ